MAKNLAILGASFHQMPLINKAKEIIRQNEKNAQSKIEGEKKDLTSVLNEVYSKSVVTSSDLKRAQGLSNYVSGSEKSLHSQFTGQWAELSSIETQMHEDQIALTEEKEKREDEITTEKEQISQNNIQTSERIDSLQTILDESSGHWIIESRNSIPAYSALTSTNHDIKSRYVPFCFVVYGACLISCVLTAINIISKNRSRISTWQQHGLEYRIIKSIFVRRSALATGIGALLGSTAGCILSPVLYINSSSDISGSASSYLKIIWIAPLVGTIILITAVALASYASLESQTDRIPAKKAEPEETASSPRKEKETSLRIDALQEDMLQRFGDD